MSAAMAPLSGRRIGIRAGHGPGAEESTSAGPRHQGIAGGTGSMTVVNAISSGRLPRWLRVTLVASLLALACGVGLLAYRHTTQPKTLTVAAGSLDGYVPRYMSAIAARQLF